MINTQGVMHFTIAVSDVDRSEQFYTEILGLERVAKNAPVGMVFLKSGEDFVILTQSKTPIQPNPSDEIFVHHAFKVDAAEYDEAKQDLESNGVRIIHEENRTQGVFLGRQCYFHDPDHNVLEIIEYRGRGGGF